MADIERFECFPTCIYRFKHEFEGDEKDHMLEYISNESFSINDKGQKIRRLGSQLNDQLHENELFKNLTATVLESSHYLMEEQGYEYDSLEITNMWGNILQPQSSRSAHAPHTHSNNFLSGAFYLKTSSETAPITFFDPRPQASVFQPRRKKLNRVNSHEMSFKSQTGYGIIFPSWLQHWVAQSNEERVSIAWNIIVRGEHGEPHGLQNAKI